MPFKPIGVDCENTENEFLMEQKGIFNAESPFHDFSPLSGYQDHRNIKSDPNIAFGTHLSMPFQLAGVYSKNTENEFLMEHKGIFNAESLFHDFSRLSGYWNHLNIKSDPNIAFGTHLSMPFQKAGGYSENYKNEFLFEQKGIFKAESPFNDFSRVSEYRDLESIKLDKNNAVGTQLSMPFQLAGVYSKNTENELFME